MREYMIYCLMDDMIKAIEQIESIETNKTIWKTIVMDPQLLCSVKKNKNKNTKTETEKKIPKKRVVTQQKQWMKHIENCPDAIQIHESYKWFFERHHSTSDPKIQILLREIHRKLEGYRRQDIEKDKYEPGRFVDYPYVEQMLSQTLDCFYCKEPVKLLYEMSRDPKQWTLERLDNNQGHNKGNVQISCLNCNLRRRTMYHEKYKFTKQMRLVKDDCIMQSI